MRFRRQQSNLFPIFAFNAVTFVLYVLSGKWGLSLAFLNSNATAVWPPSGIALTALLLGGIEVTPSIFLGALAVNLLVPGSAGVAPFIAVGNTAEALIAYALIKNTPTDPAFSISRRTSSNTFLLSHSRRLSARLLALVQ